MKDDTSEIWREVEKEASDSESSTSKSSLHPAFAVGLGGIFILNVAAILSLPPVLRGKGAPYLPTFTKKLDVMFLQLCKEPSITRKLAQKQPIRFCDLGSGDGRVVFRAAREGMFERSIGYEINPRMFIHVPSVWLSVSGCRAGNTHSLSPVLHLFAQCRRCFQPKYWSSTAFFMRDLWKVQLHDIDVVAVYGLNPIMDELGAKLQEELQPGSVVVSNVFSIPGWKPSNTSTGGVYVYSVPSCWEF